MDTHYKTHLHFPRRGGVGPHGTRSQLRRGPFLASRPTKTPELSPEFPGDAPIRDGGFSNRDGWRKLKKLGTFDQFGCASPRERGLGRIRTPVSLKIGCIPADALYRSPRPPSTASLVACARCPLRSLQKASSRLTLVLCPSITTACGMATASPTHSRARAQP